MDAPVVGDVVVVVVGILPAEAAGADHRLIGDEQELGVELDAHLAVDAQALAVELPLARVPQIGPGQEGIGGVAGQLAVQADLQGQDAVVEAEAAEGVDVALEPQGGEVIVHRLPAPGFRGPGAGVHLIGVDGGRLEVQLQGDARAEGGGDGDDAHPGVEVGLEAEAGPGGHAAAGGAEDPLLPVGVVVELPLVVALQLSADVHAGVGAADHGRLDVVRRVIGALGHGAQVVRRGDAHAPLGVQQGVVHGHAAVGAAVIHIADVQAVVAAPDEGVEHGVVLGGGDEHLEHGAAHLLELVEHPGDVAVKGVAHLVVLEGEIGVLRADAPLHLHQQGGGVRVHQVHIGEVGGLEGHGHIPHQLAVLIDAGPESGGLLAPQPAGVGHGGLGENGGVGDHGDIGEGEGVDLHLLLRQGGPGLPGHGDGAGPVCRIQPPEHEVAGELGIFKSAVGAHLAGGAQHIPHLELPVRRAPAVGHGLGGEEGGVLLPIRRLLQHHHGAAGAQDAVGGHGALDVHQHGEVCVIRKAQLEPVLQRRVGEGAVVPLGVELGGVQGHRQLAVAVGGEGDVLIAGHQITAGTHVHTVPAAGLAVVPLQIDAAPEGDLLVGVGRAVGLHQVELRLGGGHQGGGVQGVELQLGRVPLPADQRTLGDGAQQGVGVALVVRVPAGVGAGPQAHIAVDAVGLVEGQQAVAVGGDGPGFARAVGVGEGGLPGGAHLEEVELVPKGVHIHPHAVGHVGGGVGGGDGGGAVQGGGDRHPGLGQVGLIAQVQHIVPEAALLVVDGHIGVAFVGRRPFDAVAEAAPVVLVGVDAHILDEAQLLPQGQDLRAVGGKLCRAAHLVRVGQGDGVLPVFGHDAQRPALVHPDHQGVPAGGEGIVHAVVQVLGEGDGVGVVQVGIRHLLGGEGDLGAVAHRGIVAGAGQAADGVLFGLAPGHAGDGHGAGGGQVVLHGEGEVQGFPVGDAGLAALDPQPGGLGEDGEGGGGFPGLGGAHAHLHGVLALGIGHFQVFRRDGQRGFPLCAVRRVFHGVCFHGLAARAGALVQGDGEIDVLSGVEVKGVGDPGDCGVLSVPEHRLPGVLGDVQDQLVPGGDDEGDGIGFDFIALPAVVRRESEADLAGGGLQLNLGLGGVAFDGGDRGNALIVAAPGAGLVGGVGRGERRLELVGLFIRQGDGVLALAVRRDCLAAVIHHADGDALHIHLGGHGDGLGQPVDGGPLGLVRRPLVHLELDSDDLLLIGALHGVGVCREGEGVVCTLSHDDGVGLARVTVDDQAHDIVRVIGELAVKCLVFALCIMFGGDGKGDFVGVPVIAGGEGLHRVFQHRGVDGNAGDGDVIYLIGLVAPVVGDAGVRGDAHGEGAVVDLLDLVEEGEVLAAGAGVEVAETVLCAVDGDFRAAQVTHLDELIAGDFNGDHVAALVGALPGGDGESGGDVLAHQRKIGFGGGGGIAVYIVSVGFICVAVADLIPCHRLILTDRQIQKQLQRIDRGVGGRCCGDYVIGDVRCTTAGGEVERKPGDVTVCDDIGVRTEEDAQRHD